MTDVALQAEFVPDEDVVELTEPDVVRWGAAVVDAALEAEVTEPDVVRWGDPVVEAELEVAAVEEDELDEEQILQVEVDTRAFTPEGTV